MISPCFVGARSGDRRYVQPHDCQFKYEIRNGTKTSKDRRQCSKSCQGISLFICAKDLIWKEAKHDQMQWHGWVEKNFLPSKRSKIASKCSKYSLNKTY